MIKKRELTLYQQHVETWKHGCGSLLCEGATKIVLARGKIPADVVFVGEAPGESENILGIPFIGVAGKLLDNIVRRAVGDRDTRCAFTNLVGCIPREEESSRKAIEPDDDAVICCGGRLRDFIEVCNPQLIVCVGKLSTDWLDTKYKHHIRLPGEELSPQFIIPRVSITHPAAILRANIAQRDLAIQRCVITISNAIEEYVK